MISLNPDVNQDIPSPKKRVINRLSMVIIIKGYLRFPLSFMVDRHNAAGLHRKKTNNPLITTKEQQTLFPEC